MKITKLFRVIMTALIIASFCSAPLYAATNIGTSISTDDDLTVDGDVQFTTGAGAGLVLTSDALGNATWQAVPAPAETDPIYGAAPAAGITAPDIVNWDTAFGWGNHAVSGYLLLETDPQIGANTLSYVPRWNGSALVTGTIYDDGAAIAIGHAAPSVELDVNGDLRIRNLMNCDTIDTDANGNFSCGTDNSGSADFSDGGEAGGANRTLGNTDTFNLGFLTDNQTRLSIESDGDIKYNAPATAGFTFDGTTTRTGTAPLIFVDGVIDTTVAGDDLSIIDVDVTRDAGDTGSLYGVDVELTYNNLGAGEDLYGGVFNVNLNNALADGTIIGVLGSSIATTSATGASIGAANFSVNSGSGFSVGTYSIGRDATSASAYTAGGIFASAQDINSSVMSAGVAVMGASTGGASGIPTDFGLAVTDYQGDPTFGDEGFVVGVGVHPTTLTTGILIQPPAGSTYTTGIDIDNSQGGTVTTGLQIDGGTNAIVANSGAVLFNGTTGGTPTSGAGTRLMWIPAKSAFRAGVVSGTDWDDGNVGSNSFAVGANNIASGPNSFAIGPWVQASGTDSFAIGSGVDAGNKMVVGVSSVGIGLNSTVPTLVVTPGSGAGTNGDVGIGVATPGARFEVEVDNAENEIGLLLDMDDSTNNPNALVINNAGTGYSMLIDEGDTVLDANLVVGGSTSRTSTIENGSFALGGNDAFFAGDVGIEDHIYVDGNIIFPNSLAIGTHGQILEVERIEFTDINDPGNGVKFIANGDEHFNFYFGASTGGTFSFRDKDVVQQGGIKADGNNTSPSFGFVDKDSSWVIKMKHDDYISFAVNNSEIMRVEDDGTVGIGTTTPGAELEVDGGIRLNPDDASKPTCDASHRGELWYTESGAGVTDTLEICGKDAGDAYAWRTLW